MLLLQPLDTYSVLNKNSNISTHREESSQTNVILHYKFLTAILSGVCSVIQ